jgi:hypothetical protein
MAKPDELQDDIISVEEMDDLVKRVENFYQERFPITKIKMNIIWLGDLILKRLKKDFDYFTNVEGMTGTGKSNLILLLSLMQCRHAGIWKNNQTGKIVKVLPRTQPLPAPWQKIKVGFEFEKNMSFLDETNEVQTKFHALDRYHPFIIDEGSKNLHKYQWNNSLQFMLVKMSQTERYQNKAMYVCFPNFKELNSAFRNDRIKMRLYLYDRNKAAGYSKCIISLKDNNRYITDPWSTDENAKKYDYILRKKNPAARRPEDILYAEKKLKGYAGNFEIPSLEKMAPRIWNIYMNYKMYYAKKDADSQIEDVEEDTSKRVLLWKGYTRRLIEYIQQQFPNIKNSDMQIALGLTHGKYVKLLQTTETVKDKPPEF